MSVSGEGVSQNNENLIISKHSDLPRFYTINGIKYDIDNVRDIARIPLFKSTFYINGQLYGMDTILFEHRIKSTNQKIRQAAYHKMMEFRNNGIINKSQWEINMDCDEMKKETVFQKNRHLFNSQSNKHTQLSIDDMDGSQFEIWCAELLRNKGFSDVTVNGKSGDQGVDILATNEGVKYAIQCKCYSSDLGNTPIQEVYAGKIFYNCHVAVVMTNRKFTPGGVELAESTGVLLWDRDWIERESKIHGTYETIEQLPERFDFSQSEEYFSKAVDIIFEAGHVSVPIIKERLNIGYAHAARIVDEMEANGIVGPFQGSTPRDILITKAQWDAVK